MFTHFHRSILTKRLIRRNTTKLDMCQVCLDLFFKYRINNIVIMEHHICIRTALGEVPTKVLTRNNCLRCLKNTSMSHRALYSCEIISAVQVNWLVSNIRTWSFSSLYTSTALSFPEYFFCASTPVSLIIWSLKICSCFSSTGSSSTISRSVLDFNLVTKKTWLLSKLLSHS